MITKRQGIIIWFKHKRNLKRIKRYGHLIYTSKRMKYALLYVDKAKAKSVERKLKRLPYVFKVEHSHKPSIQTEFKNKELKEIKPHNYNMGI